MTAVKRINTKILMILFAFIMTFSVCFSAITPLEVKAAELIIVLDPGHGGSDPGAENTVDGKLYQERNLNLKISQAAKEYLEQFSGVKVYMTRNDNDTYLTLGQRVSMANKLGAHALVSIHNNSSSDPSAGGALIIVADNDFRPDLSKQTKDMSNKILSHMSKLGLRNRGLMTLMANSGSYVVYYPDGSPQDYYGIVQRSIRGGFPGIIIESAFLSCPDDVRNYLSTDAKLKDLGTSIGKGIAEYYGLSAEKTYDTEARYPIDAKKLNFDIPHHADLVYAFGGSKKSSANGCVTISNTNSAPVCYLDYMGMTLQTSEYSAAVITAKASFDGADLSMYYGSDEVYTVNENYCYSTTLSTDYKHYVIDFSKSSIWDLGFNFMQLNVKGAESFSIESIEFFSDVSSIPYSDTKMMKAGANSVKPSAKPTAKPTATPTSNPTDRPTPAPTESFAATLPPTQNIPTESNTPLHSKEPTEAPDNIQDTTITPTETDTTAGSKSSTNSSIQTQLIIAIILTLAAIIAVIAALFILNKK